MPGGDRTGPLGYGPMTGRAMGYCAGYQEPGYWYPGPRFGYGRGRGFGLGRGRGWRHFGRFAYFPDSYAFPYTPYGEATWTPEREIDYLKEESNFLKEELNRIEKRMNELEKEKE